MHEVQIIIRLTILNSQLVGAFFSLRLVLFGSLDVLDEEGGKNTALSHTAGFAESSSGRVYDGN